jgi:hypothetical protein
MPEQRREHPAAELCRHPAALRLCRWQNLFGLVGAWRELMRLTGSRGWCWPTMRRPPCSRRARWIPGDAVRQRLHAPPRSSHTQHAALDNGARGAASALDNTRTGKHQCRACAPREKAPGFSAACSTSPKTAWSPFPNSTTIRARAGPLLGQLPSTGSGQRRPGPPGPRLFAYLRARNAPSSRRHCTRWRSFACQRPDLLSRDCRRSWSSATRART